MTELYALHPDQDRLQSFADGELSAREVKSLRRHTDACEKCRGALDAIRHAGADYEQYHKTLKALDPAPPQPWADLSTHLAGGTACPTKTPVVPWWGRRVPPPNGPCSGGPPALRNALV